MLSSLEQAKFLSVLAPEQALQTALARGASPEVCAYEHKTANLNLEAVLEYPDVTAFVIDASALGATALDQDISEFLARYTVAVLVVASRKGLISLEQ